tara:strand:- start:10058 stop:10702 length:645 start_codon:yes stop_codon:yes gene_type:complete
MIYLLLSTILFAQEIPVAKPDSEIVAEVQQEYLIYVAPVRYHIHDESIEAVLPYSSVFLSASTHSRLSEVHTGVFYETVLMHGGTKVYSQETISYVQKDKCNYRRDHRLCAVANNHFFLETHVTVDENELTVSMSLFNSDMQIINSSVVSDKKVVRWIRQQEVIVQKSEGMMGSSTTIHKPKEELPLKWEIPHNLMSNMVQQCSLILWTGVKLN